MSVTSVSAPAATRRGTRPSRRRRVPRVLRLLRLAVVVGALSLTIWGGTQIAQAVSDHAPEGVVHVVEPGDTVWQIVVEQYGATEYDVRDLVDRVLAANDLPNAVVSSGQELILPSLDQ